MKQRQSLENKEIILAKSRVFYLRVINLSYHKRNLRNLLYFYKEFKESLKNQAAAKSIAIDFTKFLGICKENN